MGVNRPLPPRLAARWTALGVRYRQAGAEVERLLERDRPTGHASTELLEATATMLRLGREVSSFWRHHVATPPRPHRNGGQLQRPPHPTDTQEDTP
jgi:hypothetical protein